MLIAEICSYSKAKKQMRDRIEECNINNHYFPIFSGRRYVYPKLFPLYDFRHSSLGDYLLAAVGVFFIALAITLKVYILRGHISFLVTVLLALMPLFFIKLVIFIIKYAIILRKRKRSRIKLYVKWVERKGVSHRVSYA